MEHQLQEARDLFRQMRKEVQVFNRYDPEYFVLLGFVVLDMSQLKIAINSTHEVWQRVNDSRSIAAQCAGVC